MFKLTLIEILIIVTIILTILSIIFGGNSEFVNNTNCYCGYLFTNSDTPVQILDSNKNPLRCN